MPALARVGSGEASRNKDPTRGAWEPHMVDMAEKSSVWEGVFSVEEEMQWLSMTALSFLSIFVFLVYFEVSC